MAREGSLDGNLVRFREGVYVMMEHNWEFPVGRTRALAFDGATEAFENVHNVTKQLSRAKRDSHCEELECFSRYWPNMVRFFRSLCVRRPLYSSRVRFVESKLSLLSLTFGRALDEFGAPSPDGPWSAVVHREKPKDGSQEPGSFRCRDAFAPESPPVQDVMLYLQSVVLPFPLDVRAGCTAFVADGFVYVLGCFPRGPALDAAAQFSFSGTRWPTLLSMPIGRYSCAATAHRGVIFVLGGLSRGTHMTAEAYYPMGRWGVVPSIPKASATGAAVVSADSLYVFGGNAGQGLKHEHPTNGQRVEDADATPVTRHATLRIAELLAAFLRFTPLCGPCARAKRQ